ncbi:MAG: HD domain-containing protein [Acidimicrobiales bacterium]
MERLDREGRRADSVRRWLLSLADVTDGGEISELDHALQVATRALRAGADDELVLAALCHDIGKIFGDAGHGEVAAELLRPHIRSELVEVVRHHAAFAARHWDATLHGSTDPRRQFESEPWYPTAVMFVDEWDMRSFDPDYPSASLHSFTPLIDGLIRGV